MENSFPVFLSSNAQDYNNLLPHKLCVVIASNRDPMSDKNLRVRRRASTPRSKTGCVTCKIRRLKCGEEKPGCLRCTRSGWTCDGYDSVSPSPSPVQNNSRLQSQIPNTLSSHALLADLDLDLQERLYFLNFVEETSNHLFSCAWLHSDHIDQRNSQPDPKKDNPDHFFWTVIVPREAQSSTCICHAIVAFGALSKSVKASKLGHYNVHNPDRQHHAYALQQYQKAIRDLRKSLAQVASNPRTTLMCCLLLACFDEFRGNGAFAVQHLRYAREIVLNSNQTELASASAWIQGPRDQLRNLLLKLDMRAVWSHGVDIDRTYIKIEDLPEVKLPSAFSSLEEARALGDALVWQGCCFHYSTSKYDFGPIDTIPGDIIERRDYFIQQIFRYHKLLNSFLQFVNMDLSIHPLAGSQALKLRTSILLIRLSLSLQSPESICDTLLPYFQYILSMTKATIDFDGPPQPAKTHPSAETFTFSSHAIQILYLIATKCRHRSTRHEAISLLTSSHQREWMCDSLLAGKIAVWIMELEEGGVMNEAIPGLEGMKRIMQRDWFRRDEGFWIPEERKTWGIRVELDLQGRSARVRCRVGLKGVENGSREMETFISW